MTGLLCEPSPHGLVHASPNTHIKILISLETKNDKIEAETSPFGLVA